MFPVLMDESFAVTKMIKSVPSAEIVWLDETPSALVTETEYVPASSLSGFLKISLDLWYREGKR